LCISSELASCLLIQTHLTPKNHSKENGTLSRL
jgi:hypothetical protein